MEIGTAILLSAEVFEGIARGVAAKQQLDAAVAQANAAGQTDIPDSAVDAARDFAMSKREKLVKDLGGEPGAISATS